MDKEIQGRKQVIYIGKLYQWFTATFMENLISFLKKKDKKEHILWCTSAFWIYVLSCVMFGKLCKV